MRTLEASIRNAAAGVFNNPKLRVKDIVEWSSGTIEPHDGEVVAELPGLGIYAAVKTEHDKRPKAT